MNFNKFINSDYLKENPLCGIGTYKDELNLTTGACTRQIKKLVLTGEEAFSEPGTYPGGYLYMFIPSDIPGDNGANAVSTHYKQAYNNNGQNVYIQSRRIVIIDATHSTRDDFKSYLAQQYAAGTPVTVWYVLATPTTETITVPSGLSGTVEGYLNQSGTPTPTNPIYPTANTVEQWFDLNHYIMGTSTDTITTLPADIYANDTTATVGLKGQAVQSSTPSPTSPVMPQGTGEKTAQLIDYTQSETGGIDGSGNYVPANNLWRSTAYTPINETLQYFVSWTANTNLNVVRINYYTSDKTHISREQINTSGTALTIPQNAAYLKWTLYAKTDVIIDLSFVQSLQLMINTGSTALPYEPFGVKIPISSANTTTPVYLGEVETTRAIKKLVLTGEEDYVVPNISLRVPIGIYVPAIPFVPLAVISSHFQTKNSSEGTQIDRYIYTTRLGQSGGIIWFFVPREFFSGNLNVDNCEIEFKEWLRQQYANGTPVTVWYVLAEPTTGIVNEPLMKIGDYADTLSNVSIPVTAGGDTLSVGTTVQPSEVTVNYKGWHPVQNVHERDNGAWT